MIRYFAVCFFLMFGSSLSVAQSCGWQGIQNFTNSNAQTNINNCNSARQSETANLPQMIFRCVQAGLPAHRQLQQSPRSCAATHCPDSGAWDDATGQCAAPPTCPAGVPVIDGQCALDDGMPTQCSEGYTKFTVGNQTSCIEQMPSQCGNGGKVWINGIDACRDEKDACNNSGGTFGIVNTSPVCIPSDYANQLPTCASGSAEYFDNGNGTSAFACATVTTPASERAPVNVTTEDPTGLGGKFDEVIQALERGTAVLRSGMGGAVPPVAGGTGPGQGGQQPGEGEGGEEGEGECDPTATDYAACIGQAQLVGDGSAADVVSDAETAGDAHLDAAKGTLLDFVNEQIVVEEPGALESFVTGIFPSPVACQDLTMDWRGKSMVVSCSGLQPLRDWIGFALAIGTIWYCFQIALAKGEV